MIERDGKVYRNLEEQVAKNKEDIETLQEKSGTHVEANPEGVATNSLSTILIDDLIYTVDGTANVVWGKITGSLTDQTDLSEVLDNKADKSSIPTKTSELTNDSNFITSDYHDDTKQDILVSGTNIKTINNVSLLGEGNIDISGGSAYTAGDNITIVDGVISAKDTTYTAGDNITIVNNVISAIGGSGTIADGSVTTAKLADGAVTNIKIADGTIEGSKLKDTYITEELLQTELAKKVNLSGDETISGVKTFSDKVKLSGDLIVNGTAYLTSPSISGYASISGLVSPASMSIGATNDIDFVIGENTISVPKATGTLALISDVESEASTRKEAESNLQEQITNVQTAVDKKQDKLTAGTNITISEDNVISAAGGSGGSYTAGAGITIQDNIISVSYPSIIILGEDE